MVSNVSSTASQVYAQFAAQRQALFQKSDVDGSGGLSLEEFKTLGPKDGKKPEGAPSVEDIFSQVDADGNGSVTTDELDSFAEANFKNRLGQGGPLNGAGILQAQDFISQADSDGDGALSVEEFSAAKPKDAPEGGPSSKEIFAKLDTDSDGSLTAAELEAGKPQGGPGGTGGPGGAGGPHGAGGPPPSGGGSGPSASNDDEETLDPLDLNGDGIVSASEKAAGDLTAAVSKMLQVFLTQQEQSTQSLAA